MKNEIELVKEIEDNLTLLKVSLKFKEDVEVYEIRSEQIARDLISLIQFDFRERNRTTEFKWFRYLYFYLCKKYTRDSLQTIAINGGVENHATVLNGLKVWANFYNSDKEFTRFVMPSKIKLECKYLKQLKELNNDN